MAIRPRYNLMKTFWRIHLRLYLWSSGRIGHTLRGLPVLILRTIGRKTGLPRTNALMYLPYGENFAVIASNLGEDNHPARWINLKSQNTATAQVRNEHDTVRAREAVGDEREKLWRAKAKINSDFEQYRTWTSRHIPVVVLERQ